MIRDRSFAADFAGDAHGDKFISLVGLEQVLLADIIGAEDRNKGSRCRGLFDASSPTCLLAFDKTHGADDFETELARRFNRLHGRSTRCANVVDNNHLRCLLPKALDALASAVLFFGLADKETTQLAARDRNCNHDRISTHRQPTDGLRFPASLADFVKKNLPCQLCTTSIERGGAAVNVVVAGGARGQLEVP